MTSVKLKYFVRAIRDIMELEEDIHGLRYIYVKSITLKREIDDYCYINNIKLEMVTQLLTSYWALGVVVRQSERKLKYGGK